LDNFDDTRHYNLYGATVIATNVHDSNYLDSRSVTIVMSESERQFENDPREHDFISLRERCTAFRARWMMKDLPEVVKPARHRLGDILRPLAQILEIVAPQKMKDLLALIPIIEGERADMLADTIEGQIVKVLIELHDKVDRGIILTAIVSDKVNEDRNPHYRTTSQIVGRRMRALGFKSEKKCGERGFIYDVKVLARLAKQHGLDSNFKEAFRADRALNNGARNTRSDEIDEEVAKIMNLKTL
jgi:hypothetical protein